MRGLRAWLSRLRSEAPQEAKWVADPLNPEISYRVAPEPDWPQRVLEALHGTLASSWSQPLGAIPAPGGRLLVCEPGAPGRGETAAVEPGVYDVRLTVAQYMNGGEVEDERVSHAFALLAGGGPIAHVEPLERHEGEEVTLGVDGGLAAFATPGAVERLADERTDGDVESWETQLIEEMRTVYRHTRDWARMVTADGGAAVAAFSSGEGDGLYPIYVLRDQSGRSVGLAIDFFVDNES